MTNETNLNLQLFLSHASEDKPAVQQLYNRLLSLGISVWFDDANLLPGQDWELEITKAIQKSQVVVICLSKVSVKKIGYIQAEIRRALDIAELQPEGSIYIIPLRLEECDVPHRLTHWQWVDFFSENGYEKLIAAIRVRADELEIPFFAVNKLMSSIRSSIKNLDYEEIARAASLVDVAILPTEALRELTDALFLACVQIPSTSQMLLKAHLTLSVCSDKLGQVTPNDTFLQFKVMAAKLKYCAELYKAAQYDVLVNVITPIFESNVLSGFQHAQWITLSASAHLLYVNSLEKLERYNEVISFVDKNINLWLDEKDSLSWWVSLLTSKSGALRKLGKEDMATEVENQVFERCQNTKDPLDGVKALKAGSWRLSEFENYKSSTSFLNCVLEITENSKAQQMREITAETLYKLAENLRKSEEYGLAISTCNRLLEKFEIIDSSTIEEYVAWGLVELERSLRRLKRFKEAVNVSQQIFDRFKDSNNTETNYAVAQAFLDKGISLKYMHEFNKSIEVYNSFLDLFDKPQEKKGLFSFLSQNKPDYSWRIIYALGEKAKNLRLLGKYEASLNTFDIPVERFQNINNRDIRIEIVWCITQKAYTLMQCNRTKDAIELYESIIPAFVGEGIYFYRKDFRKAIEGIGFCRLHQAKQAFFSREVNKANTLLKESEENLLEVDRFEPDEYTHGSLGYIAFLQGDLIRAKAFISEAYNMEEGTVWVKEAIRDVQVLKLEQDDIFIEMLLSLSNENEQ